MKVQPSKFHATPRPLRFEAPADVLRGYLKDTGADYDDVGESAIFEGEASRVDRELLIEGKLTMSYELRCVRCTVERTRHAKIPIRWILLPREELDKDQLRPHELIELSTDDLDVSFYTDDEVDINELVREAVLLFLDQHSKCGEEDCDVRLTELLKAQRDGEKEATVDPRWAGLAKLKAKLKN